VGYRQQAREQVAVIGQKTGNKREESVGQIEVGIGTTKKKKGDQGKQATKDVGTRHCMNNPPNDINEALGAR